MKRGLAPTEKITLTYFPVAARAEVARMCLHIGKIDYEYVEVPFEEWDAMKPSTPYGQLPLLFLGNDKKKCIAQTNAIQNYCAKIAGIYPEDIFLQAKVDELYNLLEADTNMKLAGTWGLSTREERVQKRQECQEVGKPFYDHFKLLDMMVGRETGKTGFWLDQPHLSFCDLIFFAFICQFRSGTYDGITSAFVDQFTHIVKYRNFIAGQEAIKSFYHKQGDARKAFLPDA